MHFLRVIGVVLIAGVLAGCTLSEQQFRDLRVTLKQRPDLQAQLNADCAQKARNEPRSKIEMIAELADLKVATFPQTFCKRMMSSFVTGRLTYADYRDLMGNKPTPRLLRIIRGKRP
jgi:hypothetical protein